MLGIAQNRDDASRCRYCGEKLSLLQRLSRAEYCNSQHRDAYHHDQEKLALGRLQPAPVERGPEALGRPKHGVAAAGEWPEEAAAEVVASHPVEVQRVNAPPTIVGVEYEEEDGAAADTPPLCGPICSDDVAASGRVSPIPSDQAPEEFGGEAPRMPESAVAVQAPRVQAIRSQQLGLTVPSLAGERLGAQQESGSEAPDMGMRFPALSIQSVDWSEALNRERQTWAGIPPLAGLIQIAGPQTLRFEARLRTPMALPEHPAGNPVRSYKPGLRGGGVPNLAGAIRGLGTWRTRFGSEGNLQPQWESGVVDMTVAAEWMPRYPVFYTTSPWASEGLEEIFGLGPGQGPGQGGIGIDPSATGAVMDLLENLGPGPGVSGGGFGPGAGGAVSVARTGAADLGEGLGTGTGVGLGNGSGAGTGPGGAGGTGEGNGSVASSRPGPAGPAFEAGGGGFGSGRGSGLFKSKASGNGVGDGAGSGTGDGRGAVSVEAVAALVKAARQSDRSRTPLRDIEIRLLSRPAEPKLSEAQAWRGLIEGSARGLARRGPLWRTEPFVLPAAAAAPVAREIAVSETPPVVEALPVPARNTAMERPLLALAPEAEWNADWLRPVVGARGIVPVETGSVPVSLKASIPEHRAQPRVTGGAGRLQTPTRLPEPWVEIQAGSTEAGAVEAMPVECLPAEPSKQVRGPSGAAVPDRRLGLGRLERPGTEWVLLRGSEESATFRLALDQLRLNEPGERAAEWGQVAAHRPAASMAGLPSSRGMVHRDLSLRHGAAEPFREPLVCQFGSARGGVWDSRM